MASVSFEQVWQNFIGLVVLVGFFIIFYKQMNETKLKKTIREWLEKFKELK